MNKRIQFFLNGATIAFDSTFEGSIRQGEYVCRVRKDGNIQVGAIYQLDAMLFEFTLTNE